MRLTLNGPVWNLLVTYGYKEYELFAGISLCKAFWSIVAGLPIVGLWFLLRWGFRTLIRKPFLAWANWTLVSVDKDGNNPISPRDVLQSVVRFMTLPLTATILMFLVGLGRWAWWPLRIALVIWAGILLGIVLLLLARWISKPGTATHEISLVTNQAMRAVKNRICPILRFSGNDGPESA